MKHGHVTPNPDGSKAKCGGPRFCAECALELAQLENKIIDKEFQPQELNKTTGLPIAPKQMARVEKRHSGVMAWWDVVYIDAPEVYKGGDVIASFNKGESHAQFFCNWLNEERK